MAKTDGELVDQILAGDSNAFEQLISRYQKLVFNIIYHYMGRRGEVEDLAQEVFLKVFKSLDMYDQGRPMKAWIAKITTNRCLDEMRKGRYSRVQLFSDLTDGEEDRIQYYYDRSARGASLTETEAEECFALLHKLMNRLTEKDKVAFVLREVEGLEYSEVAQALQTSQLGARIRVSRTRRKLQHSLAKLLEGQGEPKV